MMPRYRGVVAFLLLWLCWPGGHADGRPPHKQALADHFGPFLAKPLNDCRTCHLAPAEGTKEDSLAESRPHNAFGARLKSIRTELRKAGKKQDIPTRIEAVADEDSDGDGTANLIELLAGRNPGDAADRPSTQELERATAALVQFRESKKGHQWKPFEPVTRPAVPQVKNQAWIHNTIDAFIAAEHEKRGLKPRPETDPLTLLRRVYLDLIGLPPSRAEQQAFLADTSPGAYEKLVDRLLADPRHGERWGRHWMDVWRYSDWDGYGEEVRNSQRHIWHWRDWIVESINAGKGYDRMVQEMLAGDELAPTDAATVRATGFLVRNWFLFNRNVWLDSTVEHTSKAFLGVTLNCARCHAHMYDPIAQEEYYHFRAFFEPHNIRMDRVPGEANLLKAGIPRVYDADAAATTFLYLRGNDATPDKSKKIDPATPVVLGGANLKIQPVKLPIEAAIPDKRPFVIAEETLRLDRALAEAVSAVSRAEKAVQSARQNLAQAVQTERKLWAEARSLREKQDDPARDAGLLSQWQKQLAALMAAAADLARLEHVVRVAEQDQQLATLASTAARLACEELQAVLRVEKIEDSGGQQKDLAAWKQAAMAALAIQRRSAVAEARHALMAGQLVLARTKANPKGNQAELQKKVKEAGERLASAEKAEAQPLSTNYRKRVAASYPATTTGRRLALARWITDKQNPLAARVAMNHIWLRHFGQAIVPSVFDFGRNGQRPSHPALLDWLASELMEREWNMKAMHRLIVTSRTYRMDSTPHPENSRRDPDNRFLWRANSRRLEAEAVRDCILAVAGGLDQSMGGPDIDHNQGQVVPRRSLYFRHAAEKEMEFLKLFDAASVAECYQRPVSIIPQQALALANSALVLGQSRLLSRRLLAEAGEAFDQTASTRFIRLCFEQILGRPPSPGEQTACLDFLAEQVRILADHKRLTTYVGGPAAHVGPAADPQLRARENLVQVLMNHHEFVTIR